jgi:hypothetical protein
VKSFSQVELTALGGTSGYFTVNPMATASSGPVSVSLDDQGQVKNVYYSHFSGTLNHSIMVGIRSKGSSSGASFFLVSWWE